MEDEIQELIDVYGMFLSINYQCRNELFYIQIYDLESSTEFFGYDIYGYKTYKEALDFGYSLVMNLAGDIQKEVDKVIKSIEI